MEAAILMITNWIKDLINGIKSKKMNRIKEQHKRKDFFVYSGVVDKQRAKPVNFIKMKFEETSDLSILFSAFNDRYNLFEPISNYNLNSLKRQRPKDKGDKNYVTKYGSFHSDFIVPFLFEDKNNIYKDKKDFLKLLTGERRIIYIVGSVGCGKSTFISHLIYFAKQEITQQKIAIISISAKRLGEGDIDDYEKVIYQIIEDSFHSDFKKVNIKNSGDFKGVINKHFNSHRLTIIIDDLDEIYDQSRSLILKTPENKDSFDEHFESKKYIHVAIKIFSVIKSLSDDNDNVNFIIGLRDETFKAINAKYVKDTGSESLKKLRNPLFVGIDHLSTSDILDKRFELGHQNNNYKETDNAFYDFSKEFSNEFDGLHINGTRHVIAKVRELSKLDTKQLFYPKWMLQLYIYLDGIQKYSQQACGILNIFLVNIDYRNELDKFDDQWPKFSKKDHYQTFWLKYFICKYFNGLSDRIVDANMVYKKFDKYEREIFNFSLYSITDTNHGRLISCSFDENEIGNKDYKLEKTKRLEYCFDKEIFFSFVYLSVIINDAFLEIPKTKNTQSNKILNEIFNTKHFYKVEFFVSKDPVWKGWLFEHIKKVLVFVKILEMSLLNYEKDKIDLDDSFPDFDKIHQSLKQEIKSIAKTIGIKEDEVTLEIEKINEINKKLHKPLKKHFKRYSKFVKEKSNCD